MNPNFPDRLLEQAAPARRPRDRLANRHGFLAKDEGVRDLDDRMVLRPSAAFEAARPWKHVWPPLLKELVV